MSSSARLILASGSRYRAELLARLRLRFEQASPDVDETALPGESGPELARRLAVAKAEAIASRHPEAWVIGSDQVAVCEGRLLGKPGSREQAGEQLRFLAGKTTHFYTAVVLRRRQPSVQQAALDQTTVRMRALSEAEIERYLDAEPAYDCAGSAKIEGLGISLCAEVQSRDPTALIGLPLIACAELLRGVGLPLP